jgi:hypothetical protein
VGVDRGPATWHWWPVGGDAVVKHRGSWGVRVGMAGMSRGGIATIFMSLAVVVAMVVAAVLSRQSADLHRRAEVIAEQVQASTQELSALKWRANSQVLAGIADLSMRGPLVADGARIINEVSAEVGKLRRLAPGTDALTLQRDVERVYVSGLQQLALANGSRHLSPSTLEAMQTGFQPPLDRLDNDARRMAEHQQTVAASALERSLVASIGSLLLGIAALAGLGLRLASMRRRAVLAEEVREVERRSEERIRALVEPLAPSHAWPPGSGPIRGLGRGNRPDRSPRAMGAGACVHPGPRMGDRSQRWPTVLRQRERLDQTAARPRLPGRRR